MVLMGCLVLSAGGAEGRPLSEPFGWFSIPVVGITEVLPTCDGVYAQYKGTIAYKNKLAFERLEFDLSFHYRGGGATRFCFSLIRSGGTAV